MRGEAIWYSSLPSELSFDRRVVTGANTQRIRQRVLDSRRDLRVAVLVKDGQTRTLTSRVVQALGAVHIPANLAVLEGFAPTAGIFKYVTELAFAIKHLIV